MKGDAHGNYLSASADPGVLAKLWHWKCLLKQIKDRKYTRALEGYSGEILPAGVKYDRDSPDKPHSCVIERMEYGIDRKQGASLEPGGDL